MQSIRRLYVAKKDAFAHEARRMYADLKENLLIDGLKDVRLYNRYDLSGLDDAAFAAAKDMIFSEPPVDAVYDTPARIRRGLLCCLLNICPVSMTNGPIRLCNACKC